MRVLPRLSVPMVLAILARYPTLRAIRAAYPDCSSPLERDGLLKGLQTAPPSFALVGKTLSAHVCEFIMGNQYSTEHEEPYYCTVIITIDQFFSDQYNVHANTTTDSTTTASKMYTIVVPLTVAHSCIYCFRAIRAIFTWLVDREKC